MFPIQPRRWRQRDEELTPVRIRSTVRHTQDPCPGVFQCRRDLVLELVAVDGGPAAPGAAWVAGLQHEGWDYAVEDVVVVV